MAILVLGLVIFLGLHSTRIVSESGRQKAIARFGEGPWKGLYSALSAIGFVLIVWGFARARHGAPQLWTPLPGARHITMLLMLVALILLASYLFKRSHVTAAVHHPMLWSVVLWCAGHLIANGSAADLLLFGAFLVWSVADLAASYARDRRNNVVYPTPELGATAGAVVVGLIAYGLLIGGLHVWLFGVSPLAI
ncbi:MAG TPA: NnrU family protein [Roseiarcus sp.]|nr:NnrU family protein [Roseiarcus sp.]